MIVSASLGPAPPQREGCLVVDREILDRTGAIALAPDPDGLRLIPVRHVQRIWLGERPVAQEVVVMPGRLRVAGGQ